MMTGLKLPNDYDSFLKGLERRVRAAQIPYLPGR